MEWFAAVLFAFLGAAASASVVLFFTSRRIAPILERIAALEAGRVAASYVVPLQATTGLPIPAEYDTAAAWGEEMALAGFRVPQEEIERQRRMREEAGL